MRVAIAPFLMMGLLASADARMVAAAPLSVARAGAVLDGVEARTRAALRDARSALERRAATIGEMEGAQQAPPRSLVDRIDRLESDTRSVVGALAGRRWDQVGPTVRRADLLLATLNRMRERLRQFQPDAFQRLHRSLPRVAGPAGTGRITGSVVDSLSGAPLAGWVEIYDLSGSPLGSTDVLAGAFSIDGLATGTYFLVASTDFGSAHVSELYDDIRCESWCDVTTGTPITVVDGQTTPGIAFALDPYSSLGGWVLDSATDQPLVDTEVDVYDGSGSWRGYSWTGADGAYQIDRLAAGVYYAVARSPYYLDELHAGFPCDGDCQPQSGTPILVGVGVALSGVDFRLQQGGSVSGRVTDGATGDAVSGTVDLYDASGQWAGASSIGEDGNFQIYDLPSGGYFARTSTDHLDELYDGIACEVYCDVTGGTPITVLQGQERSSIDFSLDPGPGGRISGTVTDALSGAPIPSARVYAVTSGVFSGSAGVDASGYYRLGGLPAGSYFLNTASDLYVDELYDGFTCDPACTPTDGTPVPVADTEVSGVDFQLDLGGWITGQVTAQATGGDLDATVTVYRSDGTTAGYGWTAGTGRYSVPGLVTGTYFARAEWYEFATELFDELPCGPGCDPTTGTGIAVTTSQGTSGVDFTLSRLGRISGRVVESGTGLPLQARVEASNAAGGAGGSAFTDSTGRYWLTGLQPGTYFIRTESSGNVVDQLYQGKTCEPTCDVTSGTPVTAALDATTTAVDFVLRRPVFADVPVDHWAWKSVEAAYAAGVTTGCATGPLRFCPDAGVTRAQSSVFLLRSVEGGAYTPPSATGVFADVPVASGFAPWVEELYRRGITAGCGGSPPRFCPASGVTRAQSAVFLLRTREGSSYVPPAAVGAFLDVPVTSVFAPWVEELARRGVTAGCSVNPSLFCPGAVVTRAQMAVFLTRSFGLPLP
jgi:hypothetical protein